MNLTPTPEVVPAHNLTHSLRELVATGVVPALSASAVTLVHVESTQDG